MTVKCMLYMVVIYVRDGEEYAVQGRYLLRDGEVYAIQCCYLLRDG